MTWDAYNRRKIALHDVLAIADRRREEVNATMLLDSVESANHAFANVAELLLDVQMSWFQRLSGQMDRTFGVGADDLETFTINAWSEAAAEMPGARALLDTHANMPELQRAFTMELEFLGRSAGTPANHPDLIAHGRRIMRTAKINVVEIPVVPDTPAGLFARIREALAA